MSPFRPALGALAAAALLIPAAARAQIHADAGDPPCVRATIALIDPVDSAKARIGDAFRFRIVDGVTAPDGTKIPAGNLGYGVVAFASHAERGGRGGYVALEPRVITLTDGTHVAVIADRLTDATASASGASRNAPSYLGAIPFAGYLLGPYGYLHHGSDITIPVGARLAVLVGDDLALIKCRIPKAGETPPPPARRQSQEPPVSGTAPPEPSAGPAEPASGESPPPESPPSASPSPEP